MTELVVKSLSKDFGPKKVLKSLDLTIKDNEFIAILGPSGCGKTTLLRSIAGFVEPTSGEINFKGESFYRDGDQMPINKRQLGMVFQQFALWPHMTVKEHLFYPLNSKYNKNRLSGEDKERLVQEALTLLELNELANYYPHELSGGQKQRVALGRAIVSKPRILLMDEPLSALDAHLKETMIKEFKKIHQATGVTILYVTHDQKEAMALADRIIVMNNGNIEQFDTPYNLYHYPETEFVAKFVGKSQLIKGKWFKDEFYPKADCDSTRWNKEKVSPYFKKNNLFPIFPEELEIFQKGSHNLGFTGRVRDKQFLGRETQYIVSLENEQEVTVVSNNAYVANVNEEVLVNKKMDVMVG